MTATRAGIKWTVSATIAVLLLTTAPGNIFAQTRTWNGNGSSLAWGDAGNWSGPSPTGGGVETIDYPSFDGSHFHVSVQNLANPMPVSAITFEGAGYTVSGLPVELDGASITQSAAGSDTISTALVLGHSLTLGGAGNLSLGGQITTTVGATSAGLLYSGSGTVTLGGGGSSFDHLQVSSGNVTINGGSVSLTNTNGLQSTLSVSTASLVVQSGATLDTTSGAPSYLGGTLAHPASMTVTGANSKWLYSNNYIGRNGPGNLLIDAGASVTGPGFVMGIGGAGSITVQNGSSLVCTNSSQLGQDSSSTVSVTGSGSSWSNSGSVLLGFDGLGTVNVSDGGSVSVGGTTTFQTASATVNGGTFTSGLLSGSGGSISLTNPIGGTALTINGASGSDTTGIAISGSGSLLKTGGSTQTLAGGNSYSGGTTISGGTLTIGAAGALPSSSSVVDNATFAVNANTTAGTISGTGTTAVAAGVTLTTTNFIQSGLTIDLGSAGASSHAKLTASSLLSIGQLTVVLGSGIAPTPGMAFDILDWGTLSGPFPIVHLPTLPTFLSWNTSQLSTSGVLSVTSSLPGDYNHNGVVDAADYIIWRKGLGATFVQNDYLVWRAHFGQSTLGDDGSSATGLTSAVPEPGGIFMCFLTFLLPFGRTRCTR